MKFTTFTVLFALTTASSALAREPKLLNWGSNQATVERVCAQNLATLKKRYSLLQKKYPNLPNVIARSEVTVQSPDRINCAIYASVPSAAFEIITTLSYNDWDQVSAKTAATSLMKNGSVLLAIAPPNNLGSGTHPSYQMNSMILVAH